mgnify:CR=1 FL=1
MGYLTKLPHSGVRICFDVGQVRVGVAKCDRDQIMAVPVMTLRMDEAIQASVDQLITEIEPSAIYIGLPINLNAQNTQSTEHAIEFAKRLAQLPSVLDRGISLRLVDERLSTSSALGSLRASGKSAKESKEIVDQAAATEILELALAVEKRTSALAGTEI